MWTDIHKSFLQACSNHGSITKSDAIEILKCTLTTFGDDRNFNEEVLNEIIHEINEKISYTDQKIITTSHEIVPEIYIVLISTVTDPINKGRSSYGIGDRNYLAILLKEIATIDNHCLSLISATNIIYELKDKKLTKQHASKLLEMWIEMGYFVISEDIIYLGPKGIAEFDSYLKMHYPDDIDECKICNCVIFYGLKCGNDNCNYLLHRTCIKERLKKFNTCPSCKLNWLTKIAKRNTM